MYADDDILYEQDFRETSQSSTSLVKIIYYLLQIFLLVIGIGLLYYCAMLRWTTRGATAGEQDSIWGGLLDSGIILGSLMIFYATLGIVAVARTSIRLGYIYIILIIVAVFSTIWYSWWMQQQLILVRGQMSDVWGRLAGSSRATLQDMGTCCGFASRTDRPALPCPTDAVSACFPPGRRSPVLRWVRSALLLALSSSFSLSFLLSLLAIFIIFVQGNRLRHLSSTTSI